jgi:hypothetical protein
VKSIYFRTQISVDFPTAWPPAEDENSLMTVSVLRSAESVAFDVPNGLPFIFTTADT